MRVISFSKGIVALVLFNIGGLIAMTLPGFSEFLPVSRIFHTFAFQTLGFSLIYFLWGEKIQTPNEGVKEDEEAA